VLQGITFSLVVVLIFP